jgi:glycogenin glucosyltransferase
VELILSTLDIRWGEFMMTKLQIWDQTDFTKLVYIDADCVVTTNIDHLFDSPTPAFAPDIFPPDRFNAGVAVIEPDASVYERMLEALPVLGSYEGGDTGFLNAFFPDWFESGHRLPCRYNCQRALFDFSLKGGRMGYWRSIGRPAIIHYSSSPKPWESMGAIGHSPLDAYWWKVYAGIQLDVATESLIFSTE